MLDSDARPIIVLLSVLTALAVLVLLTDAMPRFRLDDDFVEYWAAGRLALTAGNPYDPQQLWTVQQRVGWSQDRPLMMWNPPWTLPFIVPIALLDYHQARFVWFLLNYGSLIFCLDWLWRYYRGPLRWRLWLPLLCITFTPAVLVLEAGNLTPLMLVGCIGYLHYEHRQKRFWAGACLSLTLLKPHLLYMIWIVCGLHALLKHDFRCLIGALGALALLSGVSLLIRPPVMRQYVCTVSQRPPAEWLSPTWGTMLRLLMGWDKFVLQFVPSVIGSVVAGVYTLYLHDRWEWRIQFPWLVSFSMITAAYGWHSDCVLLLPVIASTLVSLTQGVSHRLRLAGWASYGLLNVGALVLWQYPALLYEGDETLRITLAFLLRPNTLWYIGLPLLWAIWAGVMNGHSTLAQTA